MKYVFYIAILFLHNQNNSDKDKIKEFSNDLVKIISTENICELSNVKVFPEENAINLRAIDYILGNDYQDGFVKLFQNKNLTTEIYGPYEVDTEEYYFLIFQNPKELKYNDKGLLDADTRRANWGKNYIETLVTVIDSEVYFYRAPFFFETDIAW